MQGGTKIREEVITGGVFDIAHGGFVLGPIGVDAIVIGCIYRDNPGGTVDAAQVIVTGGQYYDHFPDIGRYGYVAIVDGVGNAAQGAGTALSVGTIDHIYFVAGVYEVAGIVFEVSPGFLVVIGRLGHHVGHQERSGIGVGGGGSVA